ncbi:unnamed protein product [Effrenium voratum]|nr:unnamed protein product [Effrenium voratum]
MLLDHDSPLLQPADDPLPRLAPEVPETEPEPPGSPLIELVFEEAGSLGIEFKELAAPFVVEQVHSHGLAHGRGLLKGDRLVLVEGAALDRLTWDDLVQKLTHRPVRVAFHRPEKVEEGGFMAGLSKMRMFGVDSGLDLGKVAQVGSAGLELTGKMGAAGLDLGKMGLSATASLSGLLGREDKDADPAAASEPAAGEGAELQQQLAAARRAEEQAKESLAQLQRELAAAKQSAAQAAELRERLASAQQAEEQAKEDLAHTKMELQALSGRSEDASALQSELEAAKSAEARARTALSTLQAELDAARSTATDVTQLQRELEATKVELAAAQGAQASSTSSETLGIELDAARQKESLAQEQIAELQRELQAAQAALSESAVQAAKDGEAEKAIAALQQDLQTAQESKQTVQKELEQARLSQDQAKEELCKLQGHLQELTSPDSKSAQELQAVRESQALALTQLAAAQSEVASLRQDLQAERQSPEAQAREALLRELQEAKDRAAELTQQAQQAQRAARPELQAQEQEALQGEESAPDAVPDVFEVLFALQGSLGLEFRALAAPYVIAKIHDSGIATGLGISEGDELIAVAEESVEQASWEDLVRKLSQRPVVAQFRRRSAAPGADGASASAAKAAALISSVGSSLLSKARGEDEAKQAMAAELRQLRGEVQRLEDLGRAKEEELRRLHARMRQKEESLHAALGAGGDVAVAKLAEEREVMGQRLQLLEGQLEEAARQLQQRTEESQRFQANFEEEARQKEEQKQLAASLQDRCNSLMKQFESLSQTCQNLTMDSQQKAGLEGQVNELLRMNAQWQHAHQSLNAESETLRQKLQQVEQLQLEVRRLQPLAQQSLELEMRLREAEQSLDQHRDALSQAQQLRAQENSTVQRLQAELDSLQESGESTAGQLEAELMERSRECATLRREKEEAAKRAEELLQKQQENLQAAQEGRALHAENQRLQDQLVGAQEEQKALNAVVERCLAKMEVDSRERPFLVDKRMVTQMLAAYLEQRENPGPQQEILHKMADLLGFTTSEREQVGLSHKRKTPLQMEEAAGLTDLTDRFVDFLMEESEAG